MAKYLINIFTGSWIWKIQNHGQIIHPTENTFHWFCSKFIVDYFRPPRLWKLLEAKTLYQAHTLALSLTLSSSHSAASLNLEPRLKVLIYSILWNIDKSNQNHVVLSTKRIFLYEIPSWGLNFFDCVCTR